MSCYIAGDWGTSNLRLFLMDKESGECLAQSSGAGVSQLQKQQIPQLLAQLIAPWQQQHSIEEILLCGMVGSTIGWLDSGYVDCPLQLARLGDFLQTVPGQPIATRIIPGIRCHSPTGAIDIMRGEETQLLGALQSQPQLSQGQHLLCLPGTHSKWVALEDGLVNNFLTSLSGELFATLKNHSILARDAGNDNVDETQFIAGVERSIAQADCDLLHLLFETRSRQISGQLAAAASGDFLSGLIIGRDIQSALRLFSPPGNEQQPQTIYFIANPALSHLYNLACQTVGANGHSLDGDELSRLGIQALRTG